MRPLRRLALALSLALASPILLAGCEQPAIDGPIPALKKEQLEAGIEKIGWKKSGTTWNDGAEVSNFIVSATREDPRGKKSPDGKSRIHLTVAVYTVALHVKERELERLQKDGHTRVQNDRIVQVRVVPAGTEDPAVIMKQLFGE